MTARGARSCVAAALAALGGAGALAAATTTTVVTADRMLDVLAGRRLTDMPLSLHAAMARDYRDGLAPQDFARVPRSQARRPARSPRPKRSPPRFS